MTCACAPILLVGETLPPDCFDKSVVTSDGG